MATKSPAKNQKRHRTLQPGEKKRSFYREKNECDPEFDLHRLEHSTVELDWSHGDIADDDYWCEDFQDEDRIFLTAGQIRVDVMSQGASYFSDLEGGKEKRIRQLFQHEPGFEQRASGQQVSRSSESLEIQLQRHLKAAAQQSSAKELCRKIVDAISSPDRLALRRFYDDGKLSDSALANVLLLSPFWIRSPETCNDPSLLLPHLFCKKSPWSFLIDHLNSDETADYKWWIWLILLGRGFSLQRAAACFGWSVPKKFQFHLEYSVPAGLGLFESISYAEVIRLGGGQREFDLLRENPAFVIDVTEHERSDLLRFWRQALAWLIKHRDVLGFAAVPDILDWAVHRHTEAVRFNKQFCWLNRTVASVKKQVADYKKSANRTIFRRWKNHGLNWAFECQAGEEWSIVELDRTEQLVEEGRAMRHCVGGYDLYCQEGRSAIFSLLRNGQRQATIEICPVTKTVRQARGKCNREANSKERELIRKWIESVGK